MKILWIAPYPVKPGQHPAPWIMMLAKEIVSAGHELTILTPSPKIKTVQNTQTEFGYQLIILPYKGGIVHLLSFFNTQIIAVKNYLKNTVIRYDIIHVHGTELQYASSLKTLNNQGPHIISIQGIISLYKKELSDKFSKRFLYWSINSHYEKNEIRDSTYFFCRTMWDKNFVKDLNKDAIITNCWEVLRLEFFNYKHQFGGKDILFMGGNNPLKALDHCLIVFNEVSKKIPLNLHIVGYADKSAIKKLAKKLKLANINPQNIILHGNLDAAGICEVYKKCFCLYHPSLIDNSPNSVCEAQVAGLPVVATNVGGVSSLIENGFTGLLIDKENLSDHVNALQKLFDDDDLKKNLSRNAREKALARHDKKSILNDTIGAYKTMTLQQYA
jgi:glycosyltransferase involved in cell wall biosynthesis